METPSNQTRNKYLLALTVVALVAATSMFVYRMLTLPNTLIEGIVACYPEINPGPWENDVVRSQAMEGASALLRANLQQSPDVGAQLIAVRTDSNEVQPLQRLRQIAASNPQSALAANHLLNVCLKNMNAPGCTPDVAIYAASLDGDNGVTWALISQYRYLRGDEYGASTALRQAVTAPRFDDYFLTHLSQVDGAIARNGDPANNFLRLQAISIAGRAMLFSDSQIFREFRAMCTELSAEIPPIAESCLAMGRRMEESDITLLMSGLGSGLQIVVHRVVGNESEARRIEREYDSRQLDQSAWRRSGFKLASDLMTYDPTLTEFWIDRVIAGGEAAANDAVVTEARNRSMNPDYRPCGQLNLSFVPRLTGPD